MLQCGWSRICDAIRLIGRPKPNCIAELFVWDIVMCSSLRFYIRAIPRRALNNLVQFFSFYNKGTRANKS